MREKVLKYIKENNLIEYGDKIVVGLSGGPDSVCLLHILYTLKDEYNLEIYSAHVNHMIRGDEAFRDEKYSRELSEFLGIKHFVKRIKVEDFAKENKMTCEEAGRFVRYNFFDEVLKEVSGNKIALAHNMNDNAETILMNIIRGTGTLGLIGIPAKRDSKYIRPILCLTREEIERYCIENNLNPKIDSTNNETIYTRNKVRLELIPYIKNNFNSNIIENLNRLSNIIKEEEEYFDGIVETLLKNSLDNKFDIETFKKQHIAIKRRLIRTIIEGVLGSLKGIEQKHIDECIELIEKNETGKYIVLPYDLCCRIEYGKFIIEKLKNDSFIDYEYKLNIPGDIYIKEIDAHIQTNVLENLNNVKDNAFIKYYDYDKIGNDIVIRNRRQGDFLFLNEAGGRKKLKDLLIDNKVPRDERDRIPLIAKGSEIVWVIGMRNSPKYRVKDETKKILKICIKRGAQDE